MTVARRGVVAAIAVGVVLAGLALWFGRRAIGPSSGAAAPTPTYVGSQTCVECHPSEAGAWRQSQHALAMAAASDTSVHGRFDGQPVRLPDATSADVTSSFLRRNGTFYVRTDGPDGQPADFEISHTFGLFPLQQYLIPQPGGRMQALGIAWDTRPSAQGGQRWFHLYPGEALKAGDPLHWTGIRQNWNFMCADCHATNLRKGYDTATREFHTTWSEIAVGCEACHGAGSRHVDRARRGGARGSDAAMLPARLDERRGVRWTIDPSTGQPVRSQPRTGDREIEVCARCHSRRSQLTDLAMAGDPLEDAFRPSLLDPALFYADGQQRDEVYNYASFLQSRMYAAGVTCSDCHDPHSGRRPLEGNAVCAQCHMKTTYDAASHHFHQPGTPAAECATCHMPSATFMVIDPRHDHSFRVPRPDLSGSLGVPNACTTSCHQRENASWAANEIRRRTGRAPGGYQRFAETFAAADRGAPDAPGQLLRIASDRTQPAIVRGSALERMARFDPADAAGVAALLADPSPMVRRSAVLALSHADGSERLRVLPPLLIDPVRTVRIQAVTALADLADQSLMGRERADFDKAFEEFLAEQRFNADRPEAQTNLGQVLLQRSRVDEAVNAFREAIRLDRTFLPAYVDLADAYRLQQNEPGAERVLREALEVDSAAAAVHHGLGLTLVRQRRLPEALAELERAASLEPATARFVYVYAVALHDSGRAAEAIAVLESAVRRHPADRELLLALAMYLDAAGRAGDARRYVDQLLKLDPNDPDARALAGRLGGSG